MTQKNYEAKYNVDLVKDQESGKTKFIEREKDELDEHADSLKAKKLAKKGIVKRSKEEKRAERRLKEKEKRQKKKRRLHKQKQTEHEDFNDLNDQVEFNDIVHAPPKLSAVKNNEARRPGKSKDLLFLNSENLATPKILKPKKTEKESKMKKKVKQRISLAKQQMLETDRLSIVEQYRALKAQKSSF